MLEIRVLVLCVNHSYRGVTRLLFNFGEAPMIFLLGALNMISNASSAVVLNTLFFSLSKLSRFSISNLNGRNPMTVGHCWALRDHGTETKNNFDGGRHSLK